MLTSLNSSETVKAMHESLQPFPSPEDWRDHWIYFLMIDRFNNPHNNGPKHDWNIATSERQGGNFRGVTEKLDYIKNLGAGAIWLTPVLKNCQYENSHHGYGIQDFLQVDPRFGSEQDFRDLVSAAHARRLYVILDIVINHAGNIFAYDIDGRVLNETNWQNTPRDIIWHDEHGRIDRHWHTLPSNPSPDAGIWPVEFQNNKWFRRQGTSPPQNDLQGDFCSLKEFKTEIEDDYCDKPVWNLLIKAHQCIIAKYDVDGFRIDTFKHVEPEFALTFCNAIREYALEIGKKNFFIFGEVNDPKEEVLARYTGRATGDEAGKIGADAVLDFPLRGNLASVAKGWSPPTAIEDVFSNRKDKQKNILSSHGEASNYFVTFLDNHDDHSRFLYPREGGDYSNQMTLALTCLFGLQGIPCLYYGSEQGLCGTQELYQPGHNSNNGKPEYVREALWGKQPNAFDQHSPLYEQIAKVSAVRRNWPSLRYGRQYFRPISGDNEHFGFSTLTPGIIAFSRILNDEEVLVIANTNTNSGHAFSGWVLIDPRINHGDNHFKIAYSNIGSMGASQPVGSEVTFYDRAGAASRGWALRLPVSLAPQEVQVLVKEATC